MTGLFQSLVPLARQMKLATVSVVSFSNRVQRSVPAVVSITAVGAPEAARWIGGLAVAPDLGAGLVVGGVCVLEFDCAPAAKAVIETKTRIAKFLCIRAPQVREIHSPQRQQCIVRQRGLPTFDGSLKILYHRG